MTKVNQCRRIHHKTVRFMSIMVHIAVITTLPKPHKVPAKASNGQPKLLIEIRFMFKALFHILNRQRIHQEHA